MKSIVRPQRFFRHVLLAAAIIITSVLTVCVDLAAASDTISQSSNSGDAGNRFNVLFIAVDDLRPELGCYGIDAIRSPNIDRLAASGRRFNHHYVQVPTCGASRYALWTGRRTSESGGGGNNAFNGGKSQLAREMSDQGAQTLPELFRRSGYHTAQIGKLSHTADGKVFEYNGKGDGRDEMPHAWDELLTPYGSWKRGWGIFFAYNGGVHREDGSGYRPVSEMPDVADNELPDGMMCDTAVDTLDRLAKSDQPFFLGVGFFKPHLPFVAPKRYWDLYEGVDIPLAENPTSNSAYTHSSGEFYNYSMPFEKTRPLADENARQMKRAYYACVSYTDAQIGRLLDKLEETGLDKNTVVVLWGDHGWHLGEHMIWGKHAPFERSLQSPLIIRVPGMSQPGEPTDALVETVDIFPTLADVCNTQMQTSCYELGGRSLKPVLDDPQHPGKTTAQGYWRGTTRTVRTPDYRIMARQTGDGFKDVELYDHRTDPLEIENIADQKPDVVESMLKQLQDDQPEMVE